jgi:hypothetical protein
MGEQHRIFFGMEMKCHVQDRFITEEKKWKVNIQFSLGKKP